jgi:hypothetical protein
VSLLAQELKTAFPISYKRLERAWAALDGTRADDKARVAG